MCVGGKGKTFIVVSQFFQVGIEGKRFGNPIGVMGRCERDSCQVHHHLNKVKFGKTHIRTDLQNVITRLNAQSRQQLAFTSEAS